MDLDGLVDRAIRRLAGVELGDRSLLGKRAALILQPRSAVDECARGSQFNCHIGELELDRLELRDRLAKLVARLRVRERQVVGGLHRAETHRGDRDATTVENVQELLEAHAARAEQVALGYEHVSERQLARVGGVPANLVQRRALRVARRAVVNDDRRDLVLACTHGDRHALGDVGTGVRDEHLGAVDAPLAVLELGMRARIARIGAGLGLGQSEGRKALAGDELGQPLLFLRIRAVQVDRHRAERRVRGNGDTDRGIDARQLFDSDCVEQRVATRATDRLWERNPHQTKRRHLLHDLVREAMVAIDFLRDRPDLGLGKVAHHGAKILTLNRQIKIHQTLLAKGASLAPWRQAYRRNAVSSLTPEYA